MKKILTVLFTIIMCLSLCACSKKEEENANVPNPIVECTSLEEINEKVGVNLIKPPTMGVENERFSIINETIAQYDYELNGKNWTIRGANIYDEDISGIYSIDNEFVEGQGATLYTNTYYLERFFDGETQYTILLSNPEDVLQETFVDCCNELERIMKYHLNDPLVGDYTDSVSQRATASVERKGDEYIVLVNWSNSVNETTSWLMYATLQDNKLSYAGENISAYVYDTEGNEISATPTASNNIGYFEIKDGKLYWSGAAQEICRTCIFEKIVY